MENGYSYFFTLVTYRRNPLLVRNIDILRHAFYIAKRRYDFDIDAVVILPDHLHLLLTPDRASEYPAIISQIKRSFTKECDPLEYAHLRQEKSRSRQRYKPVWQKRYYEHSIRNERDYRLHLDYIHFNPVKHGLVSKVSEWKFSSFERYVNLGVYHRNWCDFPREIDLE